MTVSGPVNVNKLVSPVEKQPSEYSMPTPTSVNIELVSEENKAIKYYT